MKKVISMWWSRKFYQTATFLFTKLKVMAVNGMELDSKKTLIHLKGQGKTWKVQIVKSKTSSTIIFSL